MGYFASLLGSAKRLIPERRRRALRDRRRLLRSLAREAVERAAILLSPAPALRQVIEGGARPDPARPVCVFSSYDKDSKVRDYVYHCLRALARAGCAIVFVTTSDRLDEADAARLAELCVKVARRQNRGYDFYSWKTGLELYPEYRRHEGVLLLNDSVVGPFGPFEDILARMAGSAFDVVGLTDSRRFFRHIQSYCIFVKRSERALGFLESFFGRLQPYRDKNTIIRKNEVGFSRAASKSLAIGALYPVDALRERLGSACPPEDDINQTYYYWRELIEGFRFPFVKKSVISSGRAAPAAVAAAVEKAGYSFDPALLGLG